MKESAENGMNSDKHKGKHKDDEESADNGMNSDKHKGKHKDDEESAENGMSSDKHKGKHKDDEESADNGMSSDKHKGKHKDDEESAEKTKDTDSRQHHRQQRHITVRRQCPAADGDQFGRLVRTDPTDIKPIPSAGPAPGCRNTIIRSRRRRFARSPSPMVRGARFKCRIMGQA